MLTQVGGGKGKAVPARLPPLRAYRLIGSCPSLPYGPQAGAGQCGATPSRYAVGIWKTDLIVPGRSGFFSWFRRSRIKLAPVTESVETPTVVLE